MELLSLLAGTGKPSLLKVALVRVRPVLEQTFFADVFRKSSAQEGSAPSNLLSDRLERERGAERQSGERPAWR